MTLRTAVNLLFVSSMNDCTILFMMHWSFLSELKR